MNNRDRKEERCDSWKAVANIRLLWTPLCEHQTTAIYTKTRSEF